LRVASESWSRMNSTCDWYDWWSEFFVEVQTYESDYPAGASVNQSKMALPALEFISFFERPGCKLARFNSRELLRFITAHSGNAHVQNLKRTKFRTCSVKQIHHTCVDLVSRYRDSARLLGECVPKKMRGHLGQKIAQKSRSSCKVNGRGCGCIGTVDSEPKCVQS